MALFSGFLMILGLATIQCVFASDSTLAGTSKKRKQQQNPAAEEQVSMTSEKKRTLQFTPFDERILDSLSEFSRIFTYLMLLMKTLNPKETFF